MILRHRRNAPSPAPSPDPFPAPSLSPSLPLYPTPSPIHDLNVIGRTAETHGVAVRIAGRISDKIAKAFLTIVLRHEPCDMRIKISDMTCEIICS